MRSFFPVQAKGARDLLQKMSGYLDRSPLLKPCVPGNADTGEVRNLLTAQARGPPPLGDGQVNVGRDQALAP